MINAGIVVEQQVAYACCAGVSRSFAACARLLALPADAIERNLAAAPAGVVARAVQVQNQPWLAECALSNRVDAGRTSLVALIAASGSLVVDLLVGLAGRDASVREGVEAHVAAALRAEIGLVCTLFAVAVAWNALISLDYAD